MKYELPAKVVETDKQLRALQRERQDARHRIEDVTAQLMAPAVDTRSAWELAQDGAAAFQGPMKNTLREDLEFLRQRERFLDEAIAGGERQLNKLISEASVPICDHAKRTLIIPEIRKILTALEVIRKSNLRIGEIRAELIDAGIHTGSIPADCIYRGIGSETDHGLNQSSMTLYIKSVKEGFGI